MEKLRCLLQRTLGTVRHHMGTDQFGNKYYFVPQQKTWTGRSFRERRFVDPVNKNTHEYQLGHIPTEWEAWIRGKRKNPPTIEEILQNEKSREEIKTKAEEALERDTLNLAAGHRDGLVAQPGKTQIKGHASATLFGKQVPSEEPSSTANTFQPGSWAAPAAADQKK
ncbi:NADH:ubiquinone oxidoreductase complex assembly factor 2 L homeolog isoform X1 [Xenopus laevis]|uniref:LOC495351 protein n=1 Tax=Xenopus laevis TaxID=8355 RepID=Q5U569_XENLA|nr:NADH:ubiquinone oxidoreductase complex assembly factor 2 L homeolog [Xenopus laevis]XP_041438059.1 NADH:ubiquinone oxidoreductase complex assembly factor 2 L homeolog isoform X1 [Xenopus laevis]AAH84815.1 LOC495351 protein [Xenopus laevis]